MLGILPLSSYPISALPLPTPLPVTPVTRHSAIGGVGPGTIYGDTPSTHGLDVNLLCKVIPSYLYFQYTDDVNLPYFVEAYNQLAQEIISWFCGINLPIYTGAQIAGNLLDIVASGIYGLDRPTLTTATRRIRGPLNTFAPNTERPNGLEFLTTVDLFATTDDVFKRIITWDFYKGDGQAFTIPWLKRRIMRFLTGINGIDPHVSQTYQVSVAILTGNRVVISILTVIRRAVAGGALLNTARPNTFRPDQLISTVTQFAAITESAVLAAAIAARAVELPFQFDFIVQIDGQATGYLYDNNGALGVLPTAGYPTSSGSTGAIWSNAGQVSVSGSSTPDPSAPPVYFPGISASALLALGGGNLPLTSQAPGSGQLWNNAGDVNIS